MRICYFTPNFLPQVGGTEVVTDALATEFHRTGHDVVVLARGQRTDLDRPYPVEWFREPLLRRWFPERVARSLRACHRRHRCDLFLVNYAHPTGYAATLVGADVGVPVVIVSHGGDLFRQGGDRSRPHIWRRTEHAYRHADGLVAISPYIASLIHEIVPQPRMMRLIPNGVDLETLRAPAPRPDDFPNDRPFVLCLGNLITQKGFEHAIAGFAAAQSQLDDLAMVIVGDGRLRESLACQAQAANLADAIHFVGRRTGADKRWFLQNCRFGLAPSIEEGHPIVGLEFLATGKPLICTTIAPFDGMYDDGINSLRVEPGRPEPIAEALIQMRNLPLTTMGEESIRRAQGYAWPHIAARYIEFLEEVRQAYAGGAPASPPSGRQIAT